MPGEHGNERAVPLVQRVMPGLTRDNWWQLIRFRRVKMSSSLHVQTDTFGAFHNRSPWVEC